MINMLGTCKECGYIISRSEELPKPYKSLFECSNCGHPHIKSEIIPFDVDLVGKVFQHFKGGVYLVLSIEFSQTVKYMRLSDKEIFHKSIRWFTSNKELPSGEVVKRFRLLEGYSFTDGAQNERERILDLIDREIECLECHAYADKTFGLCRAKKLIEKSAGD